MRPNSKEIVSVHPVRVLSWRCGGLAAGRQGELGVPKQSQDDLRQHLREQLEFLRASGEAFDAGRQAEAKRLATHIRILVHDTSKSVSLLQQLVQKERLRYVDTSHPPEPPGQIRIDAGLATVEMSFGPEGTTRYRAPLGDRERQPPKRFEMWWTITVLKDMKGNGFSRRDLVLALAHLDGGAHVDPELEAAYSELSRSNSIGFTFFDGGGNLLLVESPALANVRQIAWELQTTIEEQLAELLRVPEGESRSAGER